MTNQPEQITIFDTTLRDGEQSPGGYLNVEDKLMLAKRLKGLCVDVIEAGFPISSQGDYHAVRTIAEQVPGVVIAGLARAREHDVRRAGEALQPAIYRGEGRIHTFIGTSESHRIKLGMGFEQICEAAANAVELAKEYTDNVEFSAEDAMRTPIDDLARIVEIAIGKGATTVNIPDTTGYKMPDEVQGLIRYLFENVPNIDKAVISVHCHGDLLNHGANSMAAVMAGARQIECTVNGIGERAGNCPLEVIVGHLKARADRFGYLSCNVDTAQIAEVSQLVRNLTGISVQPHWPINGENAFAHLAGIHQHGVARTAESYEILKPEDFGYKRAIVIGARSGTEGVKWKFREDLNIAIEDEGALREITQRIVQFAEKYGIKKMMDDELLMAYEGIETVPEEYHLLRMNVESDSETGLYEARIWVRKSGETTYSISNGVGTIDAAVNAVKRAVKSKPEENGLSIKDHNSASAEYGSSSDAIYTFFGDFKGHMIKGRARHPDTVEAATGAYIDLVNRACFMGKYV